MKRITAYISTRRVHAVVEQLLLINVNEVMVTEFYRPLSQVSRIQLLCEDERVEAVLSTVRRFGSNGSVPDTYWKISEYDPALPDQIPLGERMSRLEEPRLARLVRSLLRGVSTRITLVFIVIAVSVVGVGVFTHLRLKEFQQSSTESERALQQVTRAAHAIEVSHLEELLATERLHSAPDEMLSEDFKKSRSRLEAAVRALEGTRLLDNRELGPLLDSEARFQFVSDEMFQIVRQLALLPAGDSSPGHRQLLREHATMMKSLDDIHRECMSLLATLERTVGDAVRQRATENAGVLLAIRISLTGLAALTAIITGLLWLLTRWNVSQPIQALVEEARALDDNELK